MCNIILGINYAGQHGHLDWAVNELGVLTAICFLLIPLGNGLNKLAESAPMAVNCERKKSEQETTTTSSGEEAYLQICTRRLLGAQFEAKLLPEIPLQLLRLWGKFGLLKTSYNLECEPVKAPAQTTEWSRPELDACTTSAWKRGVEERSSAGTVPFRGRGAPRTRSSTCRSFSCPGNRTHWPALRHVHGAIRSGFGPSLRGTVAEA